jgi:serine/threonine protein kinase
MKPLSPNTLLQNRYLIVHLIGKGGMGEVYLAVDQRLGSAIALKRTFFSDDETFGNAFEREARTLARLRHPVLPKVSDHFTENDMQYLAMEHIAGEDLSERLEINKKPFPLDWVLFWADQLLDALAYLHSHEPPIIHRDIKPQNLKLTDENHIVLLDFGLAKNSLGQTRITTSGSVTGYTPYYAPMEQIRGSGTDARTDIYSLSATLYQILTNTVPPDSLTRVDDIINGLTDPIRPVNELNPEVSKPISDVILKGMSISQEQRYSGARQMQTALRDAYARQKTGVGEPTVALNTRNSTEILQSKQSLEFNTSPPVISQVPATDLQSHFSSSGSNAALQNDFNNAGTSQKQSNLKTKISRTNSSPSITSGQGTNSSPKTYSPEAAIPSISFDNQNGEANSNQMPTATKFDLVLQTNGQNDFLQSEKVRSQLPFQLTRTKAKSKFLAIFGGLGTLLLVIIGIGWYMFGVSANTKTKIIAPLPTPEAISNTNISTEGQTAISNTNNQRIEQPAIENTPETVNNEKPVRAGQPTSVKAANSKATPQNVTAKTPKPNRQPKPKQSPKGGRTDILQ